MIKICDMTSRSYFGKMNSTLGSVVPLAMFIKKDGATSNGICFYLFSGHFLTIMVFHAAPHCSCTVLQVSVETERQISRSLKVRKFFQKWPRREEKRFDF